MASLPFKHPERLLKVHRKVDIGTKPSLRLVYDHLQLKDFVPQQSSFKSQEIDILYRDTQYLSKLFGTIAVIFVRRTSLTETTYVIRLESVWIYGTPCVIVATSFSTPAVMHNASVVGACATRLRHFATQIQFVRQLNFGMQL